MSRLRPFQTAIKNQVLQHWQDGAKNVLIKAPTGSGKTVMLADIVRAMDRATAVIAHRAELVSQISVALAREGLRHRIIGPDSLRRACATLHMSEFGRVWYDPGARVGVCSVDTLTVRAPDPWFNQVQLWVQDEAHHVLRDNKWGRAAELFPGALGLGVTATPSRADGRGLGAHADGLFDAMVEGPSMRDLIEQGYLTDYRVFAPPSDVDYSGVTVTSSGDYSPAKLRAAVHASDAIVGDVVRHYLQLARGKLGVAFAVDVEAAKDLAAAFKSAGVPSEVVTAKTPDVLRAQILRDFAARKIMVLVNVDLFGEGFDLPAIEVVMMVRKTESWPLYVQQFGRTLRLLVKSSLLAAWGSYTDEQRRAFIAQSDKPVALIIDHVGNVIRHGLPDAARVETLDSRERRSNGPSDAIPVRTCANPNVQGTGVPCLAVYPRMLRTCPHCGYYPEPVARTAPEFVDGDLFELTAEALAAMRGKVALVDGAPRIPNHLEGVAAAGVRKQHEARQRAQSDLRAAMALWAGWQRDLGRSDSECYRAFYHTFAIDVLSAQALGRPDAVALCDRVQKVLSTNGVVPCQS